MFPAACREQALSCQTGRQFSMQPGCRQSILGPIAWRGCKRHTPLLLIQHAAMCWPARLQQPCHPLS